MNHANHTDGDPGWRPFGAGSLAHPGGGRGPG